MFSDHINHLFSQAMKIDEALSEYFGAPLTVTDQGGLLIMLQRVLC